MPGTTQPNNFLYTPRPDLTGIGVLLFAASWLLVIGLLNLFYAISVIAGSGIFITTAGWLVGDARPWGWLMLIVALRAAGGRRGHLRGQALGALDRGHLRLRRTSLPQSCFSRTRPCWGSCCSGSTSQCWAAWRS